MYDMKLHGGRVYIDGAFVDTNLYVKDGRIAAITTTDHPAEESYDCSGNLVVPGILDPHTHFALDLGSITSVDNFRSGSIAAAYGGVTTIVDFLEPVATTEELIHSFQHRMEQAASSLIDVKFHACFANPKDNLEAMTDAMLERGMNTVKVFTTYSDSNRRTIDSDIRHLLELSKQKGFIVTAHIENDEMILLSDKAPFEALPINRPTTSETTEALKLAQFVRETGGTLYMVHCSSGDTLAALVDQFDDVLHNQFIIESCPHYFTFDNSVLKQEDGYLFTMAPPLRSERESQLLRDLIDHVDTIGTDHCPFLSIDKNKAKLVDMPLGIGGVEASFRIMHTLFGDKIIDKMTKNVAKIHGLYPQKGVLQVGSDADLFVYHQEPTILTTFHGNCDYSVYDGMPVDGSIVATMSRGQFIIKNDEYNAHQGQRLHPGGE